MKKLFIILFFCVSSEYCFSQDTVYVEGIFIQRYLKSETLFRIDYEILKQQGKSFQQMIDYKVQSFYFTLKIDSTIILMKENDIESIICANQNYKNIEIYKFSDMEFDNFKLLSRECKYYVNSKDSSYVYQIYRVNGNALRFEIKNDYFNKQRNIDLAVKWNITPVSINKNIPSFYIYSFYDIDAINCGFPISGFEIWTCR